MKQQLVMILKKICKSRALFRLKMTVTYHLIFLCLIQKGLKAK